MLHKTQKESNVKLFWNILDTNVLFKISAKKVSTLQMRDYHLRPLHNIFHEISDQSVCLSRVRKSQLFPTVINQRKLIFFRNSDVQITDGRHFHFACIKGIEFIRKILNSHKSSERFELWCSASCGFHPPANLIHSK